MATEIPFIPPGMVEWLETVFPTKIPTGDVSHRELDQQIGSTRVIDTIRAHAERQRRDILTPRGR